jgi:hypothetical protein
MILCQMACTWVECCATRVVRAMEGIIEPTRMAASERDHAIVNGFIGRCVSPYQVDVLSPDLCLQATTSYRSLQHSMLGSPTLEENLWTDLFRVSAAVLTWDAFEYIMRRHDIPGVSTYRNRISWIATIIPTSSDVTFDTRMVSRRNDRVFHVRVHALTRTCTYHVVWDVSSTEIGMASIRALLHPFRTCHLLVLSTMGEYVVSVTDPDALWAVIFSDCV